MKENSPPEELEAYLRSGGAFPDLVVMDGSTPGFFEHDGATGWHSFRPFEARLGRPVRRFHMEIQ